MIDVYRIEIADKSYQAMLSALYIAGYRTGMIISGAGALYLADFGFSWKVTLIRLAADLFFYVLNDVNRCFCYDYSQGTKVSEAATKRFDTVVGYIRFFVFFSLL